MSLNDYAGGKSKTTLMPHDLSACRAQVSKTISALAYCLLDKPTCKYAEPFNSKTFCFHPKRGEIIARTNSELV
jgi:hypothetical protein